MITRIEIDGFKSLRDVALDLEPLTAVIGPNGSGKSNFVEALRFLSQLAGGQETSTAFRASRGTLAEQFLVDRACMRFAVELLLDPHDSPQFTRCRYELELIRSPQPDGSLGVRVERERLRALGADEDEWMRRHAEWKRLAVYAEAGAGTPGFERPTGGAPIVEVRDDRLPGGAARFVWPVTSTALGMPAHVHHEPSAGRAPVREALRRISTLHLNVDKLRQGSDPGAAPGLEHDGANLPKTLATLDGEAQALIRAAMIELVPGFDGYEVGTHSDGLLGLAVTLGGHSFPSRVVSDGTLRLLALLTQFHAAPANSVSVVEEPENGVDPAALRRLIERLRARTTATDTLAPQFILVSHSPAVVAALQDNPECLAFAQMARSGDGTRFTRLLHVRRADQAPDGGRTSVSPRQIRRLLETAASIERA